MRISTFFYTLRQGFVSIFRNAWFSLASIATISACLFLFGLFYSVVLNFQNIVQTAEEGVSITVFFNEGMSEDEILEIGEKIVARTEVAKVNYISAEEAWETFKEEYLGEYSEGFTENPLADSANYEIYLTDIEVQASLVTYLESVEGIRQVNCSEVMATTLTGVNQLVSSVSVAIIAILLAVSVFLISNTVRIGISVRQEEIEIMKYVGATNFFVRTPFVIEGIIIGILGSVMPLAAIYFLYNRAIEYVMTEFDFLSSFLNFLSIETIFVLLVPVSIGIGAGIGFVGSFNTVRKHLHV